MTLYRFLFAPVLLAVAVLTGGPRRAPPPVAGGSAAAGRAASGSAAASHGPAGVVRLRSQAAAAPRAP